LDFSKSPVPFSIEKFYENVYLFYFQVSKASMPRLMEFFGQEHYVLHSFPTLAAFGQFMMSVSRQSLSPSNVLLEGSLPTRHSQVGTTCFNSLLGQRTSRLVFSYFNCHKVIAKL
jgi:hypothetical protein